MQEWKIQELKHMESRPYRNLWRSKLQSGCVWLSMVESRQLVASSTELTCLVPRVGVIHFDVEADSDSGAQKLRVFILLLYSVFSRTCVQRIWLLQSHVSLLYDMTACVIRTFICVPIFIHRIQVADTVNKFVGYPQVLLAFVDRRVGYHTSYTSCRVI